MGYSVQFFAFQELEFVRADDQKTYFINRESEQLENIDDPDDVLELVQIQYGSSPFGGPEILERYMKIDPNSGDGIGKSVIVDSSPEWLDIVSKQ